MTDLKARMLRRIRQTHPDPGTEPPDLPAEDALDWHLRPRDAAGKMKAANVRLG